MQTNTAAEIWRQYEDGIAYQDRMGLRRNLPRYVEFYEGKQWPAPTKNTKNLPRPVINVIKMICRNKKAAIVSSPVRIRYKSNDPTVNVELFNSFAEYIQKDLEQKKLDKEGISDGIQKGGYFFHYYWDNEAVDARGVKRGALRCELIDPLNIFFENPCQKDEQKQQWIIISSRMNVEAVRKLSLGASDTITGGKDDKDPYGTIEQSEDKLVTVLTKYYRVKGEVYCQRCTKDALLGKAFPITPQLQEAEKTLRGEDDPNIATPDRVDTSNDAPRAFAYLYPVVVGNYEPKSNCIYGMGEVEGLIANQKSINFNFAMSLLNNQEVAWGKYIVAPGALKGQTITNVPGQVLIDHTGTGNGIKKMTEQALQAQPVNLAGNLIDLTRSMSGASEISTGEISGAMSGEAIALLQSQAKMPIDDLRDSFLLVKEKQGKVMAQFFRLYYYQEKFTITKDEEKAEELTFSSSEFASASFDVIVEATSGTRSSIAGDIQLLNQALSSGSISFETYIRAYPDEAIGNKQEILNYLQKQKEDALVIANNQLEQALKQLEEYSEVMKKMNKTVESALPLIEENASLKATILNMYKEADEQIRTAEKEAADRKADAAFFANEIYKNQKNNNDINFDI